MSSYSIGRERGFLATDRLLRTPTTTRPNLVAEFLSEAGEMLRGAIEAPLRRAERDAVRRNPHDLEDHLRKDIGLYN